MIKVVGSEITELDRMRAYCVALAAATTVIIASQLGLPISSTHVAVGAVFGIGFLRESIKANYGVILETIRSHHMQDGHTEEHIEEFLFNFENASFEEKGQMIKMLKSKREELAFTKNEQKMLRKQYKKQLVKRSALYKIVIAWVVTVPISAILGAVFYFTIRGMLLD